MSLNKLFSIIIFLFLQTLVFAQVVTNSSELASAISASGPGTTIKLADGTWNNVFISIDKNGTSAAPITITAETPGAVKMTGNSRVYMEGSYLTVSGLIFQEPSNLVTSSSEIEPIFELKRCDFCKVLNNKIDTYNGTESQKSLKFKWILADGEHNEIAYNSFIGKYGVGSIINDNRNSSEPDYLKIHHNYFADRTPINGVNDDNDQDAIRIGNSSTSLDDSFSEVYDNYFYNFFGEVEIISNKSGQNKYYNNTFRNYAGTLTLRHGNNCEAFSNYFFAEDNIFSGGIRVIGENHKVYNNYIEGVNSKKDDGSTSNATGGINVTNGRLNSAVNGYYQVKNTQIVNNTFVNCDYALRVGTKVSSDLTEEPENLIVANNIMYNSSVNDYQILTPPSGTSVSEGNLPSLPLSDMTDDGSFFRLTDGSSPIGSGIGDYDFLNNDILGGNRDNDFDAGAEEFAGNGEKLPFSTVDVGVTVGFGVLSNPTLAIMPSSVELGKYESSMTFEVIANVDWEIIESIDWLSFDVISGTGSRTVTVTVDENTTGIERSANIDVSQISGGDGLSTELEVVQLNTFVPIEIPIVAATSIGMQVKEGIIEENAYDDDNSTYWTGDPDTEDEVSITFDLSCKHILSEIGINFWKADERATIFSIAIADNEDGPYTTVIENTTSAESGVTVDTEQFYSLGNSTGRFVKFIGIGNSSSTNWTSIANVNVYGDLNCLGTTSTLNYNSNIDGISLYPVPITEGLLTVNSKTNPINEIEVYNMSGVKVVTSHGSNNLTRQIDVSKLSSGAYIINLVGIGQLKFMKS